MLSPFRIFRCIFNRAGEVPKFLENLLSKILNDQPVLGQGKENLFVETGFNLHFCSSWGKVAVSQASLKQGEF